MQTFAEALAFGKKQGLGLEPMLDVVTSGPLAAPLFKLKGEMLKSRDFTKQFPVALLLKDMDLVLQEGREQGVYLPVSAAAREAVSGTQALGYGDEDMMALVKFTEKIAGLEPQPD
ncbi:MAG: NAD-binding protein [Trueperaceae bacterium]|nr:NAD-binding protein [Trueperaceae bacterium]